MNVLFSRPHHFFSMVLMAAFLAIQSLDISTYPLVGSDEATLNDPGLQLIKTGHFRSDVLSLNPGYEQTYLLYPPGLSFAAAASYLLFGFGLWQTRLPGIVFGALGVALIFYFVRELTQRNLPAILAALALFVWPAWVVTAKMARMDTAAICFLLIASILIYRCTKSKSDFRPAVLFLSGLSVSMAGVFHPASFTWSLSLLVVIMLFSVRPFLSAATYCVGAAVVVGAWLTYAMQYPEAFDIQFLTSLTNRTGMGSLPNRFAEEGLRYLRELERIPTIALAVVFAIVGLTIGKQLSKRYFHFLIVLAAVLVFANAVIAGKGSGFYTLYPMLLILCLVAIGIANCANLGGTAWASLPVLGLIVYGLFLANAAAWSHGPRLLALIFQGKERKYADIFKPLSNALRPGDEVWGSTVAWYAVVRAGARIDSKPEPIPIKWNTHPNPDRHRYVVIESGGSHEFAGFRKVDNFGVELQPVLGSRLSNASYVFELWKSQRLE